MGCTESKLGVIEEAEFTGDGNGQTKIQPVLTLPSTQRSRHRKPRKRSGSRSNPVKQAAEVARQPRRRPVDKADFFREPRLNAKYDFKAVIGKGSYSCVVRVEHRSTRQPYAIKTIEAPEGRELFEAELGVLRRVNHPNVIRLVEVFESDDRIFMVMELATGGNLLDRLEAHGNFTETDSLRVIRMVLSGLHYLHRLGITHRDLKPDNLLYYHPGADSRLMITDFGFASTRKPDGDIYMHTVCGTPQYLAPEIVARRPYTCAVDMWAVGVVAYILLSGSFPFDSEQDAVIFRLIMQGKYDTNGPVWDGVSPAAKDCVRRLLEKDPQKRLTVAQSLHHPWITGKVDGECGPNDALQNLQCTPSQRSARSAWSGRSNKSVRSLRSGHRHVRACQLDAVLQDLVRSTDMA